MTQFEMDVGNWCNWRLHDTYSDETKTKFIELVNLSNEYIVFFRVILHNNLPINTLNATGVTGDRPVKISRNT